MKALSKKILIPGLVVALLAVVGSCKQEPPEIVPDPTPYELQLPDYYPPMVASDANPLTNEGVSLGRHLYYDQQLSKGGPLEGAACATCHQQQNSFASHDPGLSVLPHINQGWNTNYLWDGKFAGTPEEVMQMEIQDFFQADLDVLRNDARYPEMFKKAFGTEEITYERAGLAMAQFFRSLVSYETEFDSVIMQQGVDTYSDLEAQGYLVFFSEKGDCFHCHTIPFFTTNGFSNNGLDAEHTNEANWGLYKVTQNPADKGKFKIPTLRNVELTAPYMHDGRYATLEEVVEFYNSGVQETSPTLDPIMTKPGKEFGLQLTEEEKASLVAFLKTLTDRNFVNDSKFAQPF
jgi:cytochrome c peroxidase